MHLLAISSILLLDQLAAAVPPPAAPIVPRNTDASCAWDVSRFRDFITFGDSYTDENRLNYFSEHNGSAPPPGTFLPESFDTPGGGRTWARYVVQYTGKTVDNVWQPLLTLYDYAVSGAVCSNDITPRFDSGINEDFPSLTQYELPAFLADRGTVRNGTDTPYFTPARIASDAVYVIWDGTNDLGVDAFLTDSQVPGTTIATYTDCIFDQFDTIYAAGGRYFVLNNLVPLNLAPLYANATSGGVGPNHYWTNKPSNLTAIADKMAEYVALTNEIWQYRTPYEVLLANRYPGSHWARFDVHQLILDIYTDPTAYLNGSAPANVTGFDQHCSLNDTNCVRSASPDSFLWFDELHPSEQTDRIIARNFVDLLNGKSKYATYY